MRSSQFSLLVFPKSLHHEKTKYFLILKAYLLERKKKERCTTLFHLCRPQRKQNCQLAPRPMSRKNSGKTSGTKIHNTEAIFVYVMYASFIILNALVQNEARLPARLASLAHFFFRARRFPLFFPLWSLVPGY